MKFCIYTIVLVTSLVLSFCGYAQGSIVFGNISTQVLKESIVLSTDRGIYSVGEDILFNAEYFTNKNIGDIVWSKVLYVELIDSKGKPFAQYKYQLSKDGASGKVNIPDNIYTGIYYIRAYTKWMQNFENNAYGYHMVKVINPSISRLVGISDVVDTLKRDIVLRTGELQHLNVDTDKIEYTRREKVLLYISNNAVVDSWEYSVSVVKKGAFHNVGYSSIQWNKVTAIYDTAKFLPDINDVMVSGKLISTEANEKSIGATVVMAIQDTNAYFYSSITNEKGEFFFKFPYVDEAINYYIEAKSNENSYKFDFEDSFCSKPLSIKSEEFELSEWERKLASGICVNAQIESRFNKQDNKVEGIPMGKGFYGSPDRIFEASKFIRMPNVTEFIYELVYGLTVKYDKQGNPYFYKRERNTFSIYPMLAMVDNIPVFDYKEFLNVDIEKVDRFEIVDRGYVVGEEKYKGIINIITKSNDFGGIELPDNSMLFKYQLPERIITTMPKVDTTLSSRIPDRRNCLYWDTDIKFVDGKAELEFYTSDVKGEYSIILQAVSRETREVGYVEKTFVVE